MGLTSLVDTLGSLFGFNPPMIDDIVIDVLLEENPTYEFLVTEHPVEAGLDITDTRVARPASLTLDCIFTDAPLDPVSLAKAAMSGTLSFDSWKDKKDALYKLKDQNKLISVSTPLNYYSNMMITGINPTVTAEKGAALFTRIELREIRIVQSIIGYVDVSMLPADLAAVSSQAGGATQKAGGKTPAGSTTPEATPTAESNQSIAAGLAGDALTSGQDGIIY